MPPDESLELFSEPTSRRAKPDRNAPLADRMRPTRLEDVVGQEALLAPGAALRALVGATPDAVAPTSLGIAGFTDGEKLQLLGRARY